MLIFCVTRFDHDHDEIMMVIIMIMMIMMWVIPREVIDGLLLDYISIHI